MNKPGLSIFEVMIAAAIIGLSVTTLFRFQIVLSRGVFSAHALIERFSYITGYIIQGEREGWYKDKKEHKQELEDPILTLTYAAEKPRNELQNFKHLVIERVEATWPTPFGNQTELVKKAYFTGGS